VHKLNKKLTFLFIFLLNSLITNALVPLENLELGDFSEQYKQEKTDPLNYIFTDDKKRTSGDDKNKYSLAFFRGLYEEGENLKQFCQSKPRVTYATPWERTQVKRAHIATLQYLGLDITTRAIVEYARYFEFSDSEFNNLVEGLTGNYCSTNTSVISISQLKKNFEVKFKVGGGINLPTIKDNKFFAKSLRNISTLDKAKEREFVTTIELFKTFCSWGGEVENLRLLVPLVKTSVVNSFVSRQMDGKKLKWNPFDNNFKFVKGDTVRVRCENLICRKHLDKKKKFKMPKSVGHESYYDDYNRLFCEDFSQEIYETKNQVPKLSKIIKQRTFDEDNFLVSQFVSLITGIPDFLLRAKKYDQGKEFLRASVDNSWDSWALKQSQNYQRDLYYEEPLTIELVSDELFFKPRKANFKVIFDVNVGEFDRSNQIAGKLKTFYNLKVSKSFLRWIGREWKELDPRRKKYKKDILDKFHAQITDQVQDLVKKLPFPDLEANFEKIIIKQLLSQLERADGRFYRDLARDLVSVPIEFNFAPFALKYLRFQYKVRKNEERAKDLQFIFKRREIAKK